MRDIPGLDYKLPDRGHSEGARNEQRHFDMWLDEISHRMPVIAGVDFLDDEPRDLSVGDPVRTTELWAELNQVPVQSAVISKVAYTKTGKRMAFVYPRGPSLLPAAGLWLPADDLESDGA